MDRARLTQLAQRQAAAHAMNAHETQARLDGQRLDAEALQRYERWQDSVRDNVLGWMRWASIDPNQTRRNASRFTTEQRNRNGFARQERTARLGGVALTVGKRRDAYVSEYETTVSKRIHIGELDPNAADGRTHAFVDFFAEEGLVVDRVPKSVYKHGKDRSRIPVTHTEEYSRVGARILTGPADADPAGMLEVVIVNVDLLAPVDLHKLEMFATAGTPNEEASAAAALTRLRSHGPVDELAELATVIQMVHAASPPRPI